MGFQNHYNFTENKNKMLGDLKTYNSKYQANGKISSKVFHQFILNDCKYNVIVIGDEPGDDDTNHNQEHTTPRPN
jgi:myo-inositol-hexaphosphate 3-phosphohydrolase